MIQEFIGAGWDFLFLIWLFLPGIAVAVALGFRHPLDVVTLGFVFSAAIASLSYTLTYALGVSATSAPVARGVLVVLGVVCLVAVRHKMRDLLWPVIISSTISLISVGLRNILRIDGWMQDTDHLITLWVAELMQDGAEGPMFGYSHVQKKGLIYPVLLGMGRDGLLFGAMPTVILSVLLLVTLRVVILLTNRQPKPLLVVAVLFVSLLWLSTPMFLGFMSYAHGHAMAALAVAIMARLIIGQARLVEDWAVEGTGVFQHSTWAFAMSLSVAGFLLAQARIEGFVLAVLLALPYLWREKETTNRSDLTQRIVVAMSGPAGFVVWFAPVGQVPVTSLPAWLFFALALIGSLLGATALYLVPGLRTIASDGILLALLIGLALYLFPINGSLNNLAPLSNNTLMGGGYWGYTWWLVLVALIFLVVNRRRTPSDNILLWLTAVTLSFTVVAKALDDSSDRWGTIREGWSDSVNRAVFHAFALVTAIMVVALVRFVRSQQHQTAEQIDALPDPSSSAHHASQPHSIAAEGSDGR